MCWQGAPGSNPCCREAQSLLLWDLIPAAVSKFLLPVAQE